MASKVGSVKRKAGYLYYVTGTGAVMETKLSRKGGKKGRKVCKGAKKAKKAKRARKRK